MTLSGRRARLVVGGLIASLALNLFVAGVVISGSVVSRPPSHDRGLMRLMHDLQEPQRSAIKASFAAERDALHDHLTALRDARHGLKRVIKARPAAGAAELEAALTDVALRDREMQDLASRLMVEGWRRAASSPAPAR